MKILWNLFGFCIPRGRLSSVASSDSEVYDSYDEELYNEVFLPN